MQKHVLRETLDGGQAFRWTPIDTEAWEGIWSNHICRLKSEDGWLMWSSPLHRTSQIESALPRYLQAGIDFENLADALPWRSDPVLGKAMAGYPGLRILRQPLEETLLAFLCSSNKQMVQIKQCLNALAEVFGENLSPDRKSLPTWDQLAKVPEMELRSCKLGYRANYIHACARLFHEQPSYLSNLTTLPTPEARLRLMALPGVGPKVADCILLFGLGRLEVFPIDVWILRTLKRDYSLETWKPAQIAHFAKVHFGPSAGLAQQYLFASRS